MYKIDKEITDELFLLLKEVAEDTFDKIVERLDKISEIINVKINDMYDSVSPRLETMRKYLTYLKQHTDMIFEEAVDKVTDNTLEYMKEQAEKFADSLEQFSKYIRKNQ
jgi:ABC-type taurine transport system substrate-binding protein